MPYTNFNDSNIEQDQMNCFPILRLRFGILLVYFRLDDILFNAYKKYEYSIRISAKKLLTI